MPNSTPAPRRPRLRPTLLAALAAGACGAAWADEPSPWYLGAGETLTHDTNVYRTTTPVSDTYSSTSLTGGFDQPIGRQRLRGTANVAYNKYVDQGTLDNTSYGLNAGWDWATLYNLSGNVDLSANQSLASLENNAVQPLTSRNLVKTDQISTGAHWGGASAFGLDANYAHSRVDYSAPEYFASQSRADSGSLGGSYRVGPDIRAGLAVRLTRSVSPFGTASQAAPGAPVVYSENSSNGRNLDLNLNWATTAKTNASARLSWTRQSYSNTNARDFSGLTGSLSGSFAPTAKISLSLQASRDAGTNGQFFNIAVASPNAPAVPITGLSETSQTTDLLSLGATYAATAKISVNAGYSYSHAKLIDTLSLAGVQQNTERADVYRNASLGATWALSRAWMIGCNVAHLSRDVGGSAGYSYSANTASCSAQFTLR
jgi:hypothetical protein